LNPGLQAVSTNFHCDNLEFSDIVFQFLNKMEDSSQELQWKNVFNCVPDHNVTDNFDFLAVFEKYF
jgi:hypothetical protein